MFLGNAAKGAGLGAEKEKGLEGENLLRAKVKAQEHRSGDPELLQPPTELLELTPALPRTLHWSPHKRGYFARILLRAALGFQAKPSRELLMAEFSREPGKKQRERADVNFDVNLL